MDETTHPSPENAELRTRTVGALFPEGCGEISVIVEHVYLPEGAAGTCDHEECGNLAHDPGMVGLMIADHDEVANCLLSAEEALVLANRLQRAASLVLESMEDVPDVEREAARFTQRDAS